MDWALETGNTNAGKRVIGLVDRLSPTAYLPNQQPTDVMAGVWLGLESWFTKAAEDITATERTDLIDAWTRLTSAQTAVMTSCPGGQAILGYLPVLRRTPVDGEPLIPEPGWYPVARMGAQWRYCDGVQWTEHTSP
jgi:hypothetical protein